MMDTDDSKFILKCDKSIEPLQTDNVYRYCIADWVDHLDDVAFVSIILFIKLSQDEFTVRTKEYFILKNYGN